MMSFAISARDQRARAGILETPHGTIKTPSFVPVATHAAVRAITEEDLRKAGSQVLIANTYHLHLQPGEDLIHNMGGLRAFMGWHGPLMTDSGGFQVFSLGAGKVHGVGKVASIFSDKKVAGGHLTPKKPLVKVDEDGVEFISYLDGSSHRFSPEKVIEIERKLGADMIMVLDECTSPLHDYEYTRSAMARTHRWAVRALEAFSRHSGEQRLFGIVQGGAYRDLREESATFIGSRDFHGFAVGGSLGKSKQEMHQVLAWTLPLLPEDKPRHLLGIGDIEDIFTIVEQGIDLFDCVSPSRMAGTGTFFVSGADRFRVHILNATFRDDSRPIEETCSCYACSHYSRAYLRHLFMAKEPLAVRLAAIHNLHFLESLMQKIRMAIKAGRFSELKKAWLFGQKGKGLFF